MSKSGAVSGIYETSISVHFSFRVSLKVEEEVSILKSRAKQFGNGMGNAIQFRE